MSQPVWCTHDDHLLPHPDRVRIGELCDPQAGRHLIQLNQTQVRRQLRGHHPGAHGPPPEKLDSDPLRPVNQVRRRHDLPVAGNHDSGTDFTETRLPISGHRPQALGPNHHDGRRDLAEQLRYALCIRDSRRQTQ
jgi:hypothetical protein